MEKSKNEFYNLSKDYELLYENICKGNKIACFVNYNFRGLEDYPPCRDICLVIKRKDFDIDFLARGTSYGNVSDYFRDNHTEKEAFISECERMNLEWINKEEIDKKKVIRIVAQFARKYETGKFLSGEETLEEAISEVKSLIDWDV